MRLRARWAGVTGRGTRKSPAVSSVSRTSACCRSGRYALLTGPGEADAAGLRSRPLKSKALEKEVKQLQKWVELLGM